MRPVLVLRPEPGASATKAKAREIGLEPIAVPLFEIEAVPWEVPNPGRFDALLLTSANAVRQAGHGLEELTSLPVHAVGSATAEAAREAGFRVESSGEEGVDRLLATLGDDLSLLHLCGEDRKAPVDPKQRITQIIVYRSSEKAAPELAQAQSCVALIHSPRSGIRFAELIDRQGIDRRSIAVAAISPAAADAVGAGWEVVASAESPNDDALLALAARLCNKPAGT